MKFTLIITLAALVASPLFAGPKKLLVVTTTTGFRHSSIPNLEKVLGQLGKDSGSFTVDYVHQPQEGETMEGVLKKLSPESLKNFDGIVFANTTGHLPIPDPAGLMEWLKAGHAFIGIHSASDTFHDWPGFIEMLGGEFAGHGPQVAVECINEDPKHPANTHLDRTWKIPLEEIYEFKSYDSEKVHDLLILDKHPQNKLPGHFPVSWFKPFGTGRVFYTSLGHREDIIDADPNLPDRKNPVETSKAYQQHILGGIEWALGLKPVKKHP